MKTIISEKNIINTYNQKQQEQCELFFKYKQIKHENLTFGYKKIAKLMGHNYNKTRWWHCGKHTPTPIQTANWLKNKNLIPLNDNNYNLNLIAKILGALFGDGGIFRNMNGIFLSSSELESVKEFGEDLKKIFGNAIENNSRIIEGGEYGHSWCYQNTNRNIIRFFIALGAPLGDKFLIELKVPQWILNERVFIQDDFFSSFLGGELGVPKIHKDKNRLDTLSLGITGKDELAANRIEFLTSLANYLNNKGIKTGSISINDHKKCNRKGEPTKIYKLLISTEFENITKFVNYIKLNYCLYKQEKLFQTFIDFYEIKLNKYNLLVSRGFKDNYAKELLKLGSYSKYLLDYNTKP